MDFSLDEHHDDLRDLVTGLFAREASLARLTAYEASGAPYDAATWKALAQSGVLALVLPPEEGGEGFGMLELAVVLAEAGRHVAPVPLLATLALGALPLARFGTPEQRRALLPAVADGDAILTAAWREPGTDPDAPATELAADGTVSGVKIAVPYADQAHRILVTATAATATGDGDGDGERVVVLVDPRGPGATLSPTYTSNGQPECRVELRAAPAERLEPGAHRFLVDCAMAAAAITGAGVAAGALKLTTEHVSTREQFGRPIGTFQAAATQVADVYIAARALEVAAWSGVWRLATGRDARDHLAVAAYLLGEQTMRALHTCQHLHGGLGVDVTYPLHRYFATTKYLGQWLGGPDAALDRLGALVASGSGEVA